MFNIKWWSMLFIVMLMTACSHNRQASPRFIQYAQTIPPINVPAGIKNPTGESYYPIPVVAHKVPVGTVPPLTPPGSHLNSTTPTNSVKK